MAVPVPKLAFAMNYRAAEDAKFWMGVCQFQQNMLEPAVETLDAYWRRYLDGGKWIRKRDFSAVSRWRNPASTRWPCNK